MRIYIAIVTTFLVLCAVSAVENTTLFQIENADGTYRLTTAGDPGVDYPLVWDNANSKFQFIPIGAAQLGTFGSADLLSSLTDETGTGAAVFGTDPVFSGSLTLPNSATPTTDATGELALDTTITGHQPMLVYYDGGELTSLHAIGVETGQFPALDGEVIQYDSASNKFVFATAAASFDSTTVDATTWSDGANASNVWTFDLSGTDHTMTAGSGLMTFSNDATVTGTLTAGTLDVTTFNADALLFNEKAVNATPGLGAGEVWVKNTATTTLFFTDSTNTDHQLVTKSGTPVDNQVGVWTGDGTIEGDANLTWDANTLKTTGDIELNGGGVVIEVEKFTAGDVSVGDALYQSGFSGGGIIQVDFCDNDSAATMPAIGIAIEAITGSGGTGRVCIFGEMAMTTTGMSVGEALYPDSTGLTGNLTTTKPTGAREVQKVGTVLKVAGAGLGIIYVSGANRTNDVPNEITLRGDLTTTGYDITGVGTVDIKGTGASGQVNVHLGDNAGTNLFGVYDSDVAEVAHIDSNGNAQFDGTINPGGEIFTTAAANLDLHSDGHVQIELGDAAGAKALRVRDSTSSNVFTVDSNGNVVASGGIDATASTGNTIAIYTEAAATDPAPSAAQCYGGVFYITAAVTVTLPAVATGMSVTIIANGANVVTVDPNGSDSIRLDGAAEQANGVTIVSGGTTGELVVFTYYEANGWFAASSGWSAGS